MQSVIWDWNGTLLNDIDLSLISINQLLQKRHLKLLDKGTYKEVFTFPVKEYYAAVGFDFSKEDFAIPAREYIDFFNSRVSDCSLHEKAVEVLDYFQQKGARQFVLSAMQQDKLEQSLKQQGILGFFDSIAGLNDHYATSKVERGVQLIADFDIEKENSLMVGDTIHDFEVAKKLGINCVLIPNGHQSEARLRTTGAKVIPNLAKLAKNGKFQYEY